MPKLIKLDYLLQKFSKWIWTNSISKILKNLLIRLKKNSHRVSKNTMFYITKKNSDKNITPNSFKKSVNIIWKVLCSPSNISPEVVSVGAGTIPSTMLLSPVICNKLSMNSISLNSKKDLKFLLFNTYFLLNLELLYKTIFLNPYNLLLKSTKNWLNTTLLI